jgi:hypothetical protein
MRLSKRTKSDDDDPGAESKPKPRSKPEPESKPESDSEPKRKSRRERRRASKREPEQQRRSEPGEGRRAKRGDESGSKREPASERKSGAKRGDAAGRASERRRRTPRGERSGAGAKQEEKGSGARLSRPAAKVRAALGPPAKKLGALLAGFAGAVVAAGRRLVKLGEAGLKRLRPRLTRLRRGIAAALAAASRAITPARGLLIAAICCAVLLGLSQFADYRGIAIGVESYDETIAAVAPAPEVGRAELGTAHSYLMVPAALIAIALLAVAAATGRWRLCRLAVLIGLAAVLVSFLVDRPKGLEEGELAQAFASTEAQLLGGFWVQVFAGLGLAVTSLLLGIELRKSRRPRSSLEDSRDKGGAGKGRRSGRKRSGPARHGPEAEGAKA